MQNRHRQLILGLIVLFTILQLVVLFVFGYTPYPDSNGYLYLAQESLQYGEPYPVSSQLNEYPFLWNIGAINITAASLALFHSVTPLLVLYALMKGITAWLFYALTDKICGSKTAFIALLIYLIYPANYGENTSLLSELPFMFFVLLGMYLSIVRNHSFLGGMMLAIANWFRPMSVIFLLAIIFFFLIKWRKSIKLLLGYGVMIALIGFCTIHRTGLFLYQAKTGWMALADYSTNHAPESMQVREHQEWNVIQKDSAWQSIFFDWLKDHPTEYIQQIPTKLINTYVSDNVNMCTFIPDKADKEYMYEEVSMQTLLSSFPKRSAVQWLTLLNLTIYFFIVLSALASLLYFKKDTYLLPIIIIVLGTLLLLFFGHGEARFHIPFMPFIIMLSALFINNKIVHE
jgi:4-amino-4-deoxy-L-arabinose transferase-like glycosyltransferase